MSKTEQDSKSSKTTPVPYDPYARPSTNDDDDGSSSSEEQLDSPVKILFWLLGFLVLVVVAGILSGR